MAGLSHAKRADGRGAADAAGAGLAPDRVALVGVRQHHGACAVGDAHADGGHLNGKEISTLLMCWHTLFIPIETPSH